VDLELHELELRHADLRIRDASRQRRLTASVAEVGQLVPVVVVAEGDRFVLIDGYQRVAALGRLKRDTAAATAWPLAEADALIERHHLGASGRSVLEEAWLLAHLARERGLAGDELARRFCRSKSWVSRRLALVGELSADVQVRVRAGVVPAQAAMKYLVPLSRDNRRHCDALVCALGDVRVTEREVGALYAGYRRADHSGRARLVTEPHLFLRALREAGPEPEPTAQETVTALVKDLSTVSAVAWRAYKRVGKGALDVESTYGRSHLGAAWRAADAAFSALREAIEEAWPDAGPDDAKRDSSAA
jgi:ParB family transcriptional regulator, chromosome partitioning protein